MAAASSSQSTPLLALQNFLQPLDIDIGKVIALSKRLCATYSALAAESENQFLPTPISYSILWSPAAADGGRYLAVDIGGTNLRVGFVQLTRSPNSEISSSYGILENLILDKSRVRRTLEKSWPIGEQLKHEKAEDLFAWIGDRIAEVVEDGLRVYGETLPEELPLGVTFSFPMIQRTLSDATLMSMGKGFAITSNLDLGKQLREGYAKAQSRRNLPGVKLLAIVNDSVATLISFSYQLRSSPQRKAAMGLIVGTGTNATIPLKLSSLHPSKRPKPGQVATKGELSDEHKIVVNTEWSINGAAGPLRELGFVTTWDEVLDAAGDAPGFQPFEYMTSGRYLGELGRLVIVDYFMKELGIDKGRLPPKLCVRNGLTTTLLGNLRTASSCGGMSMVKQLTEELPPHDDETSWHWTIQAAQAVSYIAKAIEVRAAGMTAAAIIGLLACAGEISFPPVMESTISVNGTSFHTPSSDRTMKELVVGYTGGCIAHFQDYLKDCQAFLDEIMDVVFQGQPCLRVILHSCQDGGIIGAGVLAGAVHSLAEVT